MSKKVLLSFSLLLVCIAAGFAQVKSGYELTFKINGIKDTYVKLAFYLGDKQYLQDSAKTDATGKVVFKGDEALEPGIYLLAFPKNKVFEFLVDSVNQNFTLETDTASPIKGMKVKNSFENKLFYEYLQYIDGKQAQVKPLRDKFDAFNKAKNKDSAAVYRTRLTNIDTEVKDYKNRIMATNPKSFVAAIFSASWEPDIPEPPRNAAGVITDSNYVARTYKAHYFDKYNFADKRLIRTPILQSKIRYYFDNLTIPIPDSINASAKYICDKACANKDVFKFCVNYITNYYETSKTMGFDAVFVFMAKEYYLPGGNTCKAFWVDSTQLAKVRERYELLRYILIGQPALELNLPDTTGKELRLSATKAQYTILYFWDPDCGHCQKETPKLIEFYKRAKSFGIEVYAVCSNDNKPAWKKYIRENHLSWINVMDEMGYRKFYDIYSTPVIYLLDKNKIIRAKRLDTPQLEDFMRKQYKMNFPPSTLPKTKDDEPQGH